MVVANVNQNPPNNAIQVQEMIGELTSTIVRTPSGRQIVVEWGEQSTQYIVEDVIRQFYEQMDNGGIIEDQLAADKQDETIHNIEENDASKDESKDQSKEQVENKETTAESKETSSENKSATESESQNDDKVSSDIEAKAGSEAKSVEKKENTSTKEGTEKKTDTSTTTAQEAEVTGATMNIKTNKNEVILKTSYFLSLKNALLLQKTIGGKIQKNGAWVNATEEEIKKYFLPNDENINKYKYQFLSLEATAGISQSEAGKFLKGKGILNGKEAIFLDAAKENNINEIYLMAHACLETGNGKSQLATGVCYKGEVVYNMFGIGAYDNSPVQSGAAYAYKAGWTTPEKAIRGGAKFISDNYINNSVYKQDTLYEMRWNPGSPSTHQYATDVAWAAKQAVWIEQIYKTFDDPHVTFDIPVYRAGTGY